METPYIKDNQTKGY